MRSIITSVAVVLSVLAPAQWLQAENVCVTVPDLASLVGTLGGPEFEVVTFAKGREDPHFVEAKPSFIKALSKADLFVQVGLDLEVGWAPVLLQNARNRAVLPGGEGFIDASSVVQAINVPTGSVDRSMGDVHLHGSPHYLLDPLNGWRVAGLLRDRFASQKTEEAGKIHDRFKQFERRLAERLVGEMLVTKYGPEKVLQTVDAGRIRELVVGDVPLGGWMAKMAPLRGARVVVDHPMWGYFLKRFEMIESVSLEPKPGVEPTTKQLEMVIGKVKQEGIALLLSSAYYDPRHANVVADQTGIRVVPMAHQVGARPGTDEYLQMIDYNVNVLTTPQ